MQQQQQQLQCSLLNGESARQCWAKAEAKCFMGDIPSCSSYCNEEGPAHTTVEGMTQGVRQRVG